QRSDRRLQPGIELLPGPRFDAAEITFAPGRARLAKPALDRAPIARLREKRRRMSAGCGDELLALFCRLAALRRELGEVPSGRRIGLGTCSIEALPQRLGDTRVLGVENLPFLAHLPHFERELRRIEPAFRQRLGTLAKLDASVVLPERFPPLELRQLL